ncbi:MAG: YhcH/YjgK/YiaL family protein [Duncaniella sp.]|jgi:YhcH/YjgK/YiaL family protein
MFIGTTSDVGLATKLHPKIKKFFEFVATHNFEELPLGKIAIDGDNVFVMNLSIDGIEADKQPLEMHRNYIDIHVVLDGVEHIGWRPIERVSSYSQLYKVDDDCALSMDRPDFYVTLHTGDFCIVFPEDPHAPAISNGKIRKLIGKVKI